MASIILVGCSLAWMILWLILGFIPGKNLPRYRDEMERIAGEGDLAQFWATFDDRKVQTVAHAHATVFSCVTFLIGLAMEVGLIGYGQTFQIVLAVWLMSGVILESLGTRHRFVPAVIVGYVLFLTAVIASFIGVIV